MKNRAILEYKKEFIILDRKVNGKRLVYLDSAATSMKPQSVIKAITDFYENSNSNIHRGLHTLSDEATVKYENSRKYIADFVNASPREIIFVKNSTEGINLVAYSFGEEIVKENDLIVVTEMEHHSNFVPWQQLAKNKNARFEVVPVKKGNLDLIELKEVLKKKPKILAITHVSNVLGTINPIKEITSIAHQNGTYVVVDGAQSVPHFKVNVKNLDCDFLVFSGHKMLGPTGIGVLYGKKELLENMKPFLTGGDMIKEVSVDNTTWNDLPWKFEAGTPPIAEVIGLGAAVQYLHEIGMDNIHEHEKELSEYALSKMRKIDGVKIYSNPNGIGVISFNLADIHSHDLATVLDEEGIAVRSGQHCAAPLMNALGINGCCRASFYIYNTKDDVDALIEGIKKAKVIFKC